MQQQRCDLSYFRLVTSVQVCRSMYNSRAIISLAQFSPSPPREESWKATQHPAKPSFTLCGPVRLRRFPVPQHAGSRRPLACGDGRYSGAWHVVEQNATGPTRCVGIVFLPHGGHESRYHRRSRDRLYSLIDEPCRYRDIIRRGSRKCANDQRSAAVQLVEWCIVRSAMCVLRYRNRAGHWT